MRNLFPILTLYLVLLPSVSAADAPPKWQDYCQPGFVATQRRQYEATALALTNRLQCLLADPDGSELVIGNYLQRLIPICVYSDNLDSAQRYCELAIRMAERRPLLESDKKAVLAPIQKNSKAGHRSSCAGKSVIGKPTDASARHTANCGQPPATVNLAVMHATHAMLFYRQGKYTQAELEYSNALRILSACNPDAETRPISDKVRLGIAQVMTKQRRLAEAEAIYRQVLDEQGAPKLRSGAQPPDLVAFAECLAGQNKLEEAILTLQSALQRDRTELGEGQPALAATFNDLACVQTKQGHNQQAQASMAEALKIARAFHYCDLPDWIANMAAVMRASGQTAQATKLQQEADTLKTRLLSAGHPPSATR